MKSGLGGRNSDRYLCWRLAMRVRVGDESRDNRYLCWRLAMRVRVGDEVRDNRYLC